MMNNPFKVSRVRLRDLLIESQRKYVKDIFYNARKSYNTTEISQQLDEQMGEVVDAVQNHSERTVAKTTNAEIITSLQLSDFYWPHSETEISFELSSGVNPDSIGSYEDLVEAIESDTHIDCQISGKGENRRFQIKTYPAKYLEHTNESFLSWFENKVLKHYGNMIGVSLVIIMQPEAPFDQSSLHIGNLAKSLSSMSERITFDEVALTYNDRGEYFALCKLYPKAKRLLIPLELGLQRMRGEA